MKLLYFGLIMGLSACSGYVTSDISSFQALPSSYAGSTIVVATNPLTENSPLESSVYASKLATYLQAAGFKILPERAAPDYFAFLTFAVDGGHITSSTYSIPQYGVTGYSGATTYGTLNSYGNMATYSGTTTLNPTYGVTGYQTGTLTGTVYRRGVRLIIIDAKASTPQAPRTVYDATALSTGSCSSVNGVIDPLLASIFKEFPGQPSETRREHVVASNRCQ